MPLTLDPTIPSADRRAALVDGARQAIADAKVRATHGPDTNAHDPAVVQALAELGELYQRTADRLELQVARETARIIFEEADAEWQVAMSTPPTSETDRLKARRIDELGIDVLPLTVVDGVTDPDALATLAATFRELAAACHR